MGRRTSRRSEVAAVALAASLVLATFGIATSSTPVGAQSDEATTSAAPSPTAARPGKPTSVAAIGDSITQSTGTGKIAEETPKNNWATGTDVSSVAARLGVPTNKRYNYSANGDRMSDFAPQVNNGKSGGSGSVSPMPADTGLVLVELGGNDLCKDSVAAMTSVTDYRNQFKAGLAAVTAKAPNALIQVMSVPDIYNLWYIRGAPQNLVYHPEPESGQASGINGARFYWDGLTPLGVKFPCQSLLADPASYAQADRDRRAAVRARNKEYNAVLAEECGKVLRCRFDGNELFNKTSNRAVVPDGPLLPQAQWSFTDLDISRNTSTGCPVPGLFGAGCGDHFHPSKAGQVKLADIATASGRNWADTTYPTATATVLPSGRPGGVHRFTATVSFGGSDNVGLRGQEVRVHNPDGSVTPWSASVGVMPNRTINQIGTSYVEVRSLDVNGNLSASTITAVNVLPAAAPSAPGTPSIVGSASGLTVSWGAPGDDGGAPVTRYDLSGLSGTPPTSTGAATAVTGGRSVLAPAPPPGELIRYRVTATNSAGTGGPSASSAPALAPFGHLPAFVDKQYRDFVGRAPTAGELTQATDALEDGTISPSAFVDARRASTWFDGAYGPAVRLYQAYFLRIPDPSGMDYWAARRREGRTLAKMSQQFAVSSEFQNRYGSLTNGEFIDQIYNNVFGRDPDPSGRTFYLNRLANGWSRGEVVLSFSESSEFKRQMAPVVDIVELHRGMLGRVPTQAQVDALLPTHTAEGSKGVFKALIATAAYRVRVHS